MDKKHEIGTPVSSSQIDLKKSFKLAVRSLLTSCSREVITSLHGNIEDEFESLCVETQVGLVLDNVEQLLEEQDLDPLYSKKTNIMEIANYLSMTKKNEIQHLKDMLKTAEEQNRHVQGRIDILRKGVQDASAMEDAVEKLRNRCRAYADDGVSRTTFDT
ncbi:uncharacterized protein LOC111810334 isoform X2 [Cucurbita pepo subsp. pepo]|uniref:Uncharacterized protein LOC111437518 isoform X2 n=1 Tax=Cucurbita moschata TaxID=3662 RepID=A0A6J1ETA0_CUCMO|nr:uncharacterized protein LOC111437518 isoform X2 [Cucurbita moschata]XP_023552811.1 uncharacterized protein LOC111810334 isoform X2 [Cucurbita pepo subsp. pepo]